MPRTRQLRSYPSPAASVGGFAIERQLRTQLGVSTLYEVAVLTARPPSRCIFLRAVLLALTERSSASLAR
jgi:hypothetical protein